MAKAMKDALNQQLGNLDNTLQPNTQDAWNNFQNQNQGWASNIAGLADPNSAANTSLTSGLNTYDQRASDMYNNPGYTDAEKQGMSVATAAGFAAPYAQEANQIKLQQQRTGNSAGVNGAIASAAREKGRMISAGLGGLQQQFGQARIQGQQNALQASQYSTQAQLQRMQQQQGIAGLGLQAAGQQAGLYGTGVQGQLGAAGLRSGVVANNPSFLKQLGSSVASGIGSGLAGFGQAAGKAAFA